MKIATAADFCGTRWTVNAVLMQAPKGVSYLTPAGSVMRLFGRHNGKQGVAVKSGAPNLDIAELLRQPEFFWIFTRMFKSSDLEQLVGERIYAESFWSHRFLESRTDIPIAERLRLAQFLCYGISDVLFKGQPIKLARPFGCYVMENVLFKISFPAEFHAQTAVEAAFKLHSQVRDRLDQIERVEIHTHESAIRIIDKTGPLHNPADRDHCLQYMTAIGLIFGHLTAEHYEDTIAADPRIDALRAKIVVTENKDYTRDYLAADKREIQAGSSAGQILTLRLTSLRPHRPHQPRSAAWERRRRSRRE